MICARRLASPANGSASGRGSTISMLLVNGLNVASNAARSRSTHSREVVGVATSPKAVNLGMGAHASVEQDHSLRVADDVDPLPEAEHGKR
jgi:hypothetical protein